MRLSVFISLDTRVVMISFPALISASLSFSLFHRLIVQVGEVRGEREETRGERGEKDTLGYLE